MSDAAREGQLAYIREEVRRQGHDLADPMDGGRRVAWMRAAWALAEIWRDEGRAPSLETIILLGRMIEPEKNDEGLRSCHVRVGPRICPPPDQVRGRLGRLLERGNNLAPLEWYREFELIHPFRDGNGRTGKVLLNWLNNTLDAPIFPPADFWGAEILNP